VAIATTPTSPRSAVRDALEGPDAAGEVDEHLLRQFWDLPQELPEVDATDHEHAQIGLGLHGGRARLTVEQAHLAEELAGAQTVAPVHRERNQRGTIDKDEELVTRLALPGEDGPLRNLDHLRDVGDRPQLPQAAGFEDGDALQKADLVLARGPKYFEDIADQFHGVFVSLAA